MRLILSCLAAAGAMAFLPAQAFQCSLVGTFNNHGPYNDVWGYVAPNGDEYALLGATTGLVVVDCSNPTNPVERGWFPWINSTWRDMRTYGTYVYVCVDNSGSGGFMIVDMQNPNAPVNLGIFGGAQFNRSHNVCVDTGTGRLYFAGTNNGTPVYDLTANPANPPFLGFAAGTGNTNYLHDLCVENGYGYGSAINAGVLRIWNANTFPPTVLSETETPSAFTHNAWPNAAGTLLVTTDERAGGLIRFFDITNKSAPVTLSQISPAPDAIPHNAFLIGNTCHVSWYTEGYQCYDVTDPTTPIRVAAYDTWPGPAANSYDGAWGCYPFQPSGNVYVSDRATGLYIVRPHLTDLTIAHTALGNSGDEVGPYTVLANVTTSNTLQSVTLRYRLGTFGAFQSLAMTATAVPNQFSAAIPGQDAPTVLDYYIEAADNQAPRRSPRVGENRFVVGTEVQRWFDDFETNLAWTSGGSTNDWQRGSTAGKAGISGSGAEKGWSDPARAYWGNTVWGNDLGPSGFNGSYPTNSSNWLQSPSIPTNGVQGLMLGYRRHLSLYPGDTVRVLVNGNVVFSTNAAVSDGYWLPIEHDISAFTNGQSQVVVRFELVTDGNEAAGGWTLDDVRLFTRHDCVPPITYGVGTPGTGGLVPALAMSGNGLVGSTPVLLGSQMFPNSVALLAINVAPADVPAIGIQLLVDPVGAALVTGFINAGGLASWPFPIPANPTLDNQYLYLQAVALDPGSPSAFLSASQGLRFRICISAP